MDSDRALRLLGTWSRWKIGLFLLTSAYLGLIAGWQMMSIVFVGMEHPHHCKLPDGYNTNTSIPMLEVDGVKSLDKCKVWVDFTEATNKTQPCPNGWVYPLEGYNTINTDWDLVCDKQYLVDLSQTIMVVGVMLGALIMSIVADKIGRKKVFVFSIIGISVVGVITTFMQEYVGFTVCRFFTGFLQQGIVLAGFVYIVELFPASQRTVMGMLCQCSWATSMWLMALFAWLSPNWRHIMLCISVPGLTGILLIWVLPQSLPWLVIKNRMAQAKAILKRAAKISKVRLPPEYQLTGDDELVLKEEKAAGLRGQLRLCAQDCCQRDEAEDKSKDANYSIMDIIRSRKLLTFAIINTYLWCANTLIYYGLSLSTGSLAGNPYLNFFLSGCVEIPAYIIAAYALKYIGRRWSIFGFHLIAGVPLFITLFIPKVTADGTDLSVVIITLSMIGKFGITGSFGSVFLYTAELFPTSVRNIGLGIASVGGRIGNFIAPFANTLAKQVWWLPNVVFGVMAILSALLTLVLPETLNRALPETIEEVEAWTRTLSKEEKRRYKAEQKVMQEMSDMHTNGHEDHALRKPLDAKTDVCA